MIIYEEKFKLRQSDFTKNDEIKISSCLDLFQTVASEHADRANIGFDTMIKQNVAWVITKVRLDILAPLRSGEVVTVKSIPHPSGKIDYTRDYYIYRENGELAVKGSSQWLLIDFVTRKIVRPFVNFTGEFCPLRAYDDRISKVPATNEILLGEHTASALDIDHNGHVNNVRYADIIYKFNQNSVKSFTVNFISECYENDTLSVYTNDSATLFTGVKQDGSVSFTAQVER